LSDSNSLVLSGRFSHLSPKNEEGEIKTEVRRKIINWLQSHLL
jgi:hypothetical protein